jgi:hypothetical protein
MTPTRIPAANVRPGDMAEPIDRAPMIRVTAVDTTDGWTTIHYGANRAPRTTRSTRPIAAAR